MFGLIVFFIIVFLLATGFAWLADQPGSLLILKFGGLEFAEENLAVIAAIAFAILLAIIFIWIVITMIWKTPRNIGGFFKNRRREKGWRAIADGVIAVGSGDISAAKRAAKQSAKFLPEEPVAGLLTAQAAQMEGKQDVARQAFQSMLAKPDTKVLGLRGLYMEAEASGETEAARLLVEQAVSEQPGLEWSGKALLSMQAAEGDWDGALVTLDQNTDSKLYDKKEAKRLRAVLLTASAIQLETGSPQKAKTQALEAHRLAPDFVPAAATASRVLARLSELRKATKVVETCWKLSPHPELMDAYMHVRSGDSGLDRLKRAETLSGLRPNHAEGLMGVARAKMDVHDWDGARMALASLLTAAPTERVCLMMSEVEEGQYGDRGRVREWLSRAVRAPRDAVWTADGYVADEWAPLSPISGELDAFEWRIPVENLGEDNDLALEEIPQGPRELPVAAAATSVAAFALVDESDGTHVIEGKIADDDDVAVVTNDTTGTVVSEDSADNAPNAKSEKDDRVNDAAADKKEDSEISDTSEELLENQRGDEATLTSDAAKETSSREDETMLASQSVGKTAEEVPADPITKRPIDDPGIKEAAEPSRKRFKLF